ncbi:MAG: hypothetical protein UT11_C0054G0005 [Berkelbacteria bacterium GW2011_GWA2_38_9]|uniref:Nucleotidyl transferase AbiEii/AbiGii toxin family protein n=1 Tax=Berkelbacteria bacterium GW2011_GWA2_38_9 TaxID=1618334 RepID=A0A0G0PD80_9BACT|nr:MAG: hypothetical protein UT11_C0054G0005 [Berkelbacteria bacterium GW2011_GWA2_38_9]
MIEIKNYLKTLLALESDQNVLYQRNILKEYFQIILLNYIYSDQKYSGLIFYGGSSLAHCYDLPRLSEDLDFIDSTKKIDLNILASDLKSFFDKQTDLKPIIRIQKFRIELKFPVLSDLGLISEKKSESDLLIIKLEIYPDSLIVKNSQIEILPLFKFNQSMLIKTFDLPTLMATKINAILNRKWEKTDKKGNISIKVKGRDYFDLMWYLQKEVKPNIRCILGVKNIDELKTQLLTQIDQIDTRSIYLDLEALIKDHQFTQNLSKNIKEILKKEVSQKLK